MKSPWQKLSSRIIHKNPWYYLREDEVIRPDSKNGKYYYIDGIDSVAVIAEDKESYIYLVGQSRYPIQNKYSWEIITGGVKKDGNPINIAKQELQEAGLIAKKWEDLGYFFPIDGYSSEKCFVYLASGLTKTKNNLESTEDITVRKEKLIDIIKMIKNNEIICGITIASIYKYLLYKRPTRLN